jgi:hypothetical protein
MGQFQDRAGEGGWRLLGKVVTRALHLVMHAGLGEVMGRRCRQSFQLKRWLSMFVRLNEKDSSEHVARLLNGSLSTTVTMECSYLRQTVWGATSRRRAG